MNINRTQIELDCLILAQNNKNNYLYDCFIELFKFLKDEKFMRKREIMTIEVHLERIDSSLDLDRTKFYKEKLKCERDIADDFSIIIDTIFEHITSIMKKNSNVIYFEKVMNPIFSLLDLRKNMIYYDKEFTDSEYGILMNVAAAFALVDRLGDTYSLNLLNNHLRSCFHDLVGGVSISSDIKNRILTVEKITDYNGRCYSQYTSSQLDGALSNFLLKVLQNLRRKKEFPPYECLDTTFAMLEKVYNDGVDLNVDEHTDIYNYILDQYLEKQHEVYLFDSLLLGNRFIYFNDRIQKAIENPKLRADVVTNIEKISPSFFDYLNSKTQYSSGEAFNFYIDSIFDSDTYVELNNKIKALMHAYELFIAHDYDRMNEILNIFLNSDFKEIINGCVISYDYNVQNLVEKPDSILKRTTELYGILLNYELECEEIYNSCSTIEELNTKLKANVETTKSKRYNQFLEKKLSSALPKSLNQSIYDEVERRLWAVSNMLLSYADDGYISILNSIFDSDTFVELDKKLSILERAYENYENGNNTEVSTLLNSLDSRDNKEIVDGQILSYNDFFMENENNIFVKMVNLYRAIGRTATDYDTLYNQYCFLINFNDAVKKKWSLEDMPKNNTETSEQDDEVTKTKVKSIFGLGRRSANK